MKLIHYLIAASLTLNAALLIHTNPLAPRSRATPQTTHAQKLRAQSAPALNLQTSTPEQLMQKLAALDFPPDLIRMIVRDRIFDTLRDKAFPLYGFDDPRYWRAFKRPMGPSQLAKIAESEREAHAAMKKLDADYKDPRQTEKLRQEYGDVSDEKIQAIADLKDKHHKRLEALYDQFSESDTTATAYKDTRASLERQQRQELSNLMTPAELFEYDVRTNSYPLKNDSRFMDITEQEFRDIFTIYQKTDNSTTPDAPSEFATQQERDDYKEAQLRQILGPDRYADFQQSKNPAYEKLNLITTRLDLPLSAAREVVTVQTDLTQRAAAIDADPTLPPAARAAQYTALAQEAKARITQTLGERGYSAYRENSKNWIQNLESGKPPPRGAK